MDIRSIPTSWRFVLGLVATAVAFYLLWYFSDIVIYILISAVLGIIGRPLVRRMSIVKIRDRYIPRGVAALITTGLMWVVFATFFSIFIPLIFNKLSEFSHLDMVQVISSINDPIIALQEHISETFSIPMREFSLTDALVASIREWLNIDVVNSVVGSQTPLVRLK
jgi:predicted PurR-regulated permease PerM